MRRGKEYDYDRIDPKVEAMDDWYMERLRQMREQEDIFSNSGLGMTNPGDRDERQADQVADKLMNDEPVSSSDFSSSQSGNMGGDEIKPSFRFLSKLTKLNDSGQPLSLEIQQDFGRKLAVDLSRVRVYTG